jgi:hypothetical protein
MQGRGWGEIPGVRETYVLQSVERERALPGSQVTRARRVLPEVQLPRTMLVYLKRPEGLVDAGNAAEQE